MVMDSYGVNIREYLANAKSSKPPYDCPYPECQRLYKTYAGIKAHLYNFDHKTGTPIHHDRSSTSRCNDRKRARIASSRSPSPHDIIKTPAREALTYAEAQRMIEVEIDGQTHRININEPMNIIRVDSKNGCKFSDTGEEGKEEDGETKAEEVEVKNEPKSTSKGRSSRGGKGGKGKHRGKSKASRYTVNKRSSVVNGQTTPNKTKTKSQQDILASLPKPSFRLLAEYNPPDAPPRPTAYYRFIDKSPDEMDEEVEYDMDEEDCAWLELMNAKRKGDSSSEVQPDTFELLMDRLEKESYFCSQNSGKDMGPTIDEDAVCCICSDGECENTNAILFCDMCNLAVHQECYGVPYIPEGQWLCRRCLQSPSRAVDCVLCPNKGGAFKQTDDNRWAHVVCALWIPEVCFANTVFLEPIDSIQNIPTARWKLTCSICKQKNAGACIQCHKNNCYVAFHVTCAQQAGLYMKMEAIKELTSTGVSTTVRKAAYCLTHTPTDENGVSLSGVYISGEDDDSRSSLIKKPQNDAIYREKMSKARKMLAEKRSVLPVVSIPTIPLDKLNKIASLINIPKRNQFIQRLLGYWTLKRSSRNGVPLLRRLQISYAGARKGNDLNDSDEQAVKLKEELKYLQKLRQNLEKARLLVELIRKREKLKLEYIKVHQLIVETTFQPPSVLLTRVLSRLQAKDTQKIFTNPVDIEEVPDYLDFIKNPMDFSTMSSKIEKNVYQNYEQFESDFNLMIENCMTYNNEGTYYYKAAVKLRDAAKPILSEARIALEMRLDPKIFKDNAKNLENNSPSLPVPSSSSISSSALSSTASSSPSVSSSQKVSTTRSTTGGASNTALSQIDEPQEDVKPAKELAKTPNSRKRPAKKSGGGRIKRAASKESNRSSSEAPRSSPFSSALPQTDSFKIYRSNLQSASESDINSESSQSSSALTGSEFSGSSSRSWDTNSAVSGDTKAESEVRELPHKFQMRPTSRSSRSDISTDSQCLIPLEPLDLVWAKCRGYPWYPALIVNPEMPKTGYFHNGVPIPVPPDDVLGLRANYGEPVYLVLFFDAKRTWQWLPRNKLEPLGVDSEQDQVKLVESKKASERKAVKKAYEKAILHRCRVTGQSTDISGDSHDED